jgi:hypothetical protein
LIGDRAIGGDAIGYDVSEQKLCQVKGNATEQRVALIDQIEDSSDDQGDGEGAPRNTVERNGFAVGGGGIA